jgi:hypothetical protein
LTYVAPNITDYGDVQDITAARIIRTAPDAEAPGEVPGGPAGTIDDTTGPCFVTGTPFCS